MSKKFLTKIIIIYAITIIVFCPVPSFAQGLINPAVLGTETALLVGPKITAAAAKAADFATDTLAGPLKFVIEWFLKTIGQFFITITAFVLTISGKIFDLVIDTTIVHMSENINGGLKAGMDNAWSTLRDIANICFIFVLLYAAFKAMFELGVGSIGKTVINIVIVALLINFSLFFAKVVIDASNIVSVGFYDSISNNQAPTLTNTRGMTFIPSGISGGYMKMLGLQKIYSSEILLNKNLEDPIQILIIAFSSGAIMIVVAVVLFMTAIMFITRFILLIFVMILSPLALIAIVVPGMMTYFKTWKNALIGQSFFAPIFFALTWIVFRLGSSLKTMLLKPENGQSDDFTTMYVNPGAAVGILLNYVLIVGFAIAALVISKQIAEKTAGFATVNKFVGGATMGVAGWGMRKSVGNYANKTLNDKDLRDRAANGDVGARMKLAAAANMSKASFDVRGLANTKMGKFVGANKVMDIMGEAGGKGGQKATIEAKVKKQVAIAKERYGQTDEEKERFEEQKKKEEKDIKERRAQKEVAAKKDLEEAEKKRKEYMNQQTSEFSTNLKELNTEKKTKEQELKNAKSLGDKEKEKKISEELGTIATRISNEREARKEREKEIEETDEIYKKLKEDTDEKKEAAKKAENQLKKKDIDDDELSEETQALKNAGKKRQENYAERLEKGPFGTRWMGRFQPNSIGKESAKKIRQQIKDRPAKDQAIDLIKKMKEEEDKAKGDEPSDKKEEPKK